MVNFPIIYDAIGIGLGPANLALAAAIDDSKHNIKSLFIERKNFFSWHPGMLFKGANLQTSFLKDLVTIHNPQSRFSFLNFLLQQERLNEFVSMGKLFPSRIEFEQYFKWAATQLTMEVNYGKEVNRILPISLHKTNKIDGVQVDVVDTKTGIQTSLVAKNIILGMGMTPNQLFDDENHSSLIFHSSQFLHKVNNLLPNKEKNQTMVVVGSGQSAAEIVFYLLTEYPNIIVHVVSRGFVFRSIDDNAFVNEHYSGGKVEDFLNLSSASKDAFLNLLSNTNYSVVDDDLINKIYEIKYEGLVTKKQRLICHSFSTLEKISEENNRLFLKITSDSKEDSCIEASALCFSTGYNDTCMKQLLCEMKSHFCTDPQDDFLVDGNYKITTHTPTEVGVFLQGYSRFSHGFTEGTLTNLAHRSQLILQEIVNNCLSQNKKSDHFNSILELANSSL